MRKKEIDILANEVINAQYDVEKFQAIVSSLTEKSSHYQQVLIIADNNRTNALEHKNKLDELINIACDLIHNSMVSSNSIKTSDLKTKELVIKMKQMVDKLIYSVEVIHKMENLIIRKKSLNPLISDDLIRMVNVAGINANAAIALNLTALKSVFLLLPSTMNSEAAADFAYSQSIEFNRALIGAPDNNGLDLSQTTSLKSIIYKMYDDSKSEYEQAQTANTNVTKELNDANSELNKKLTKLRSLQAGLAAANAASINN